MNYIDYIFRPSKYKYDQACNLFSKGNYDKAVYILNNIVDKYPLAPLKLAEINYYKGLEYEKSKEVVLAQEIYVKSKVAFNNYSISNDKYENLLIRLEITKLKLNEEPDKNIIEKFKCTTHKFKNDLLFRYSIWLIKNNNYEDAEIILNNYLNYENEAIKKLKKICWTNNSIKAVEEIKKIYNEIDYLFESDYPIENTKKFYETLDERVNFINNYFPEVKNKLFGIKPSIFNKLLSRYFNEEQFELIFELISEYPNFFEYPELLKNLGIAAFRITNARQLNENNYKVIISSWLTSVYSDNVILKSLENTSWDDDYTFTLIESIGYNYQISGIESENVNYDEVTDTNISIGATQIELVNMFEELLHNNISNPKFSNELLEFYNNEKQTLKKLIEILPDELLLVSSYFAKLHHLNKGIVEALENDYSNYDNEEALEVVVNYSNEDENDENSITQDFCNATKICCELINVLKSQNLMLFHSLCKEIDIELLNKYYSIKEKLSNQFHSIIQNLILQNEKNANLIALMKDVLSIQPDDERLKYQYSNFASNYCVLKVNNNELDNYTALFIMNNVIEIVDDDPRACKNISLLIERCLWDILNENTSYESEIFTILDNIGNVDSEILKDSLRFLYDSRQEIINQMPNIDRQAILTDYNLNSKGQRLKRVLEYMRFLSKEQHVEYSDLPF